MQIAAKILVSLGGIGFIRPASATWGSAAAGVALYYLFPTTELSIKLIAIAAVFVIGVGAAQYVESKSKTHDPHFIVIDELVGMMIVSMFLDQIWWQFVLAFLLFRLFDIAKLWPASIFDKKSGGFSVMIDDVFMAIPALAILQIILSYV